MSTDGPTLKRHSDDKIAVYTQSIAITCVLIAIVYALMFFKFNHDKIAVLLTIYGILFLIPASLSRAKLVPIFRPYTVVLMNLAWLTFTSILGPNGGSVYWMMPIMGLPFLLYRYTELKELVLLAVTPLVLFLVMESTNYTLPFLSELTIETTLRPVVRVTLILCAFCVLAGLMYFFLKDNHESREKLRSAIEVKNSFYKTIIHDLLSPLAIVKTGLDEVRRSARPEDEEIIEHMATAIERTSNLATELVSTIKIDETTFDPQFSSIDLTTYLPAIVQHHEPYLGQKNLSISVSIILTDPKVETAKNILGHVLNNYISNAIKFSEPDAEIQIMASEADAMIRISVIDSGVGILETDIDKIFSPFPKIQSPIQQRGHGLGLASCRDLAELADMMLGVESTIGSGSTFFVEWSKKT